MRALIFGAHALASDRAPTSERINLSSVAYRPSARDVSYPKIYALVFIYLFKILLSPYHQAVQGLTRIRASAVSMLCFVHGVVLSVSGPRLTARNRHGRCASWVCEKVHEGFADRFVGFQAAYVIRVGLQGGSALRSGHAGLRAQQLEVHAVAARSAQGAHGGILHHAERVLTVVSGGACPPDHPHLVPGVADDARVAGRDELQPCEGGVPHVDTSARPPNACPRGFGSTLLFYSLDGFQQLAPCEAVAIGSVKHPGRGVTGELGDQCDGRQGVHLLIEVRFGAVWRRGWGLCTRNGKAAADGITVYGLAIWRRAEIHDDTCLVE
eukprot:1079671-Prorocentrum_minimum.AAC.3